jgi:CheY-like chemotaxis protein
LRGHLPQPGLILLDLMMPRMSGTEFRIIQRADPTLTRIPVVVLSADGRMADKARLLGTEGAIRKPVDVDDLIATIKRLMP